MAANKHFNHQGATASGTVLLETSLARKEGGLSVRFRAVSRDGKKEVFDSEGSVYKYV